MKLIEETIKDVKIAILQCEFAIKLLSYCERWKIDSQEFDSDHTVLLENGNLGFPIGHFIEPDNIVRSAGVSVSLAFAASALALDQAYEVAAKSKPSYVANVIMLKTIVHMVRCAFAHGIADPKWKVNMKNRRAIRVELSTGPIEINFTELDGKNFDFDQLGGYLIWFQILDDSISALEALMTT